MTYDLNTIAALLSSSGIGPDSLGLAAVEVRFFSAETPADVDCTRDDYCDLVSVIYRDGRGRVGAFCHCSESYSDVPGDVIEGIGGEYPDGTTVSYLSDDPAILAAIAAIELVTP